jgi:hypothetical protein
VAGELLTSRTAKFSPGKEALFPLNMRLGGPQSPSGTSGEEKNPLNLPGIFKLFFLSNLFQLCKLKYQNKRQRFRQQTAAVHTDRALI